MLCWAKNFRLLEHSVPLARISLAIILIMNPTLTQLGHKLRHSVPVFKRNRRVFPEKSVYLTSASNQAETLSSMIEQPGYKRNTISECRRGPCVCIRVLMQPTFASSKSKDSATFTVPRMHRQGSSPPPDAPRNPPASALFCITETRFF